MGVRLITLEAPCWSDRLAVGRGHESRAKKEKKKESGTNATRKMCLARREDSVSV
jgi:hypothetical protein